MWALSLRFENVQDSFSIHLQATQTIRKPQEAPTLLSNNSCFSGSGEKRLVPFFFSFLSYSMMYAAEQTMATIQENKVPGNNDIHPLPCGPISLHLSQSDPFFPTNNSQPSNLHCCPDLAVLQHVHCLHPFDTGGCNGQRVWDICPSRDSCPG